MNIKKEQSDVNGLRSKNTKARSNACWTCGGIVHFTKDCTQTDAVNPVVDLMTHTLTTISVITVLIFKIIPKELVNAKAAKKV